jgi:hypothetical protein
MLLVDDILFFPVTSIFWIFREINKIAQDELAGEAQSISEQLRVLYMQLETGRITEAQFDAEEKLLLDRLDAIDRRLKGEEEPEEPSIVAQEDDTGNP